MKTENKAINKKKLIEVGCSSFTRRCIYEEISKRLEDYLNDFLYETIVVFNKEITFMYSLSSADVGDIDTDGLESLDKLDYVEIVEIKCYDLEKLFKEHNVEFEKSEISESVYFEIAGKEYRVSTHRRPDFEHNGLYYSHEYENEIICGDEVEMYKEIEKLLKEEREIC